MTTTNALCGEHGSVLRANDRHGLTCADGCSIGWSDLVEEVGTAVEIHGGHVVVVDLTEASEVGEHRGHVHAAHALAYGEEVRDVPTGDDVPGWIAGHVSDAVRTAFEQGWERGVEQAREDDEDAERCGGCLALLASVPARSVRGVPLCRDCARYSPACS